MVSLCGYVNYTRSMVKRQGQHRVRQGHIGRLSAETVDGTGGGGMYGVTECGVGFVGPPLGIEVVSPRRVSIDEIQSVLDHLGIGRLEPAELEALKAA